MGNIVSAFKALINQLFPNKEFRIVVLGLDNAGKTTILYRMHLGEVVTTIPTIGFNVETVQYKKIQFQVWDLGGQWALRPYWRAYYGTAKAVVFVVDATDKDRIAQVREALYLILDEPELDGMPLLVMANKQDTEGALAAAEVAEALNLTDIKDRKWTIQPTSALTGQGLMEGLEWLATEIQA